MGLKVVSFQIIAVTFVHKCWFKVVYAEWLICRSCFSVNLHEVYSLVKKKKDLKKNWIVDLSYSQPEMYISNSLPLWLNNSNYQFKINVKPSPSADYCF